MAWIPGGSFAMNRPSMLLGNCPPSRLWAGTDPHSNLKNGELTWLTPYCLGGWATLAIRRGIYG
jgi:hypothetical protein